MGPRRHRRGGLPSAMWTSSWSSPPQSGHDVTVVEAGRAGGVLLIARALPQKAPAEGDDIPESAPTHLAVHRDDEALPVSPTEDPGCRRSGASCGGLQRYESPYSLTGVRPSQRSQELPSCLQPVRLECRNQITSR